MSDTSPAPDDQPVSHSYPTRDSRPGHTGWIAPLALVISLLAVGAAGWTLLKPAPTPAATPAPTADTSNAGADPKGQVCVAFKTVTDAIYRYSHADPVGDPGMALAAAQEAVAANTRLAMSGGATYLLRNLSSNNPAELADEVRSFAGDIDTVAMKLLSGISNTAPEMVDLLQSAEKSSKKITELCK